MGVTRCRAGKKCYESLGESEKRRHFFVLLARALDGLADLNNVESRGKRLLELLGLLLVVNREGVEEARASDLELGDLLAVSTSGALDAGGRSVLSASNLEEFLDVGNLLRLLEWRFTSRGEAQRGRSDIAAVEDCPKGHLHNAPKHHVEPISE